MELGTTIWKSVFLPFLVSLLVLAVAFLAGFFTGEMSGKLAREAQIKVLRADSTKLANAVESAEIDARMALSNARVYSEENAKLKLERDHDKESLDTLLRHIRAAPTVDAKRAVINWYIQQKRNPYVVEFGY